MILSPFSKIEMSLLIALMAKKVAYEGERKEAERLGIKQLNN